MKSNYCKHNIVPFATPCTAPYTVSFTNGLLTAVAFLGVVVLLLITCVALLVAVLAVTANKLNKLRAQKAHTDPHHYTDPLHCHTEPGGGRGRLRKESMLRWERGQPQLKDRVGNIRSWNWGQWKGDSMRAWARRTPVLHLRDSKGREAFHCVCIVGSI